MMRRGNRQRSLRRHRRALARLPRAAFADDVSEAAVARADAALAWKPLLARMRRLPVVEQEVLALCAWGDLSYAEAAHALSIPVGTVRSRLARAPSRLSGETGAAAALAQEVTSCE